MIVGQPFSFFFSFLSVFAPLAHFPSVPQPLRLKRGRNSVFFGNSHRGEKTRLYFFLISAQSTDAGVIRDGSGVNAAGILVNFTTVKRKKILFYDGQLLHSSFVSRGYLLFSQHPGRLGFKTEHDYREK